MSRFDDFCEEYYETPKNAAQGTQTLFPTKPSSSASFNFVRETLTSD